MDIEALARDGLIHIDEAVRLGADPRDLRHACARGRLLRLRRGVYCPSTLWNAATPREQHVLTIRASVGRLQGRFLVAGRSAGAIWGLPYSAAGMEEVTILVPYRGGGESEAGVRRTSASWMSARPQMLDDIPLTSLARTTLDIAKGLDFRRAVAVIDRSLWHKNPRATTRAELDGELARAGYVRGARRLAQFVAFASPLSDSPGESEARAAIHELGFEPPELQVPFTDAEGLMHPDFYWRDVNVAGEFDGKMKYTRGEFTGGDPAETVWREKKREDRLRRQVRTVVRILTAHVRSPQDLAQMLDQAGVPRRQSSLGPRRPPYAGFPRATDPSIARGQGDGGGR